MRKYYHTPCAHVAAQLSHASFCAASPGKSILSVQFADDIQQPTAKIEFDFSRYEVLTGKASEGRAKAQNPWLEGEE